MPGSSSTAEPLIVEALTAAARAAEAEDLPGALQHLVRGRVAVEQVGGSVGPLLDMLEELAAIFGEDAVDEALERMLGG